VTALLLMIACSEERDRDPACTDCGSGVHPLGILDPSSEDFHGRDLARRDWDFALCASCHGADLDGGTAKVSCTTCHSEGPTACVTCHADGPTSGAHVEHRATAPCAECHVVPDRWDAPGHIVGDVAPAEVTFGARAGLTPVAMEREGPPMFANGSCANVYCHGDTLRAGGLATRPVWSAPPKTGTCVQCHASPPPSHAQSECATCHPASAPHVDGVVQVGDACNGCHGDASSPAPPRDLAGNVATTAIGVGAHRAHLDAPSGLRGPIACATCHVVPSSVGSVGHIDSALPAEVAPALGWQRAAQTCATASCHGASQPAWTSDDQVACGTCHDIPPATPSHASATTLASCATCHPSSVTPQGAIIVVGGTSTHIDGVVDAP
jgi:predicted CxxxxCH...CXXCH cytochrome family protein